MISPGRAAELALSYVITFPRTGLPWTMHGSPIPWSEVEAPSRPAYLAAGAYTQISIADSIPAGVWRALGSEYLVPLFHEGRPVASVAVAARASRVGIGGDGLLELPDDAGSLFFTLGIPKGETISLPVSPERAVLAVAEATGARVVAVPELLYSRLGDVAPQSARWKIDLERAVAVRLLDGGTDSVRTIYVSSVPYEASSNEWRIRLRCDVAAPVQPARDTIRYPLFPSGSEEPVVQSLIVDFLPGHPVEFHEVVF